MSRHLKTFKTKKNNKMNKKFHIKNKKNTKYNKQVGGEVMTLNNVDFSKFMISKKVDVDWKGFPGAPPSDCIIL